MSQTIDQVPAAIILAAGKGTRMTQGEAGGGGQAQPLPKVVYEVADRPMIQWVVQACRDAGVERCVVVVGYKSEMVREALAQYVDAGLVEFVEQTRLLGTAHAAKMAKPLFDDRPSHEVFVLAGDGPLIRPATLKQLVHTHRTHQAVCSLATAVLDEPSGYGRVLRDKAGEFETIIEEKDAGGEQLEINEVNPSYYCFETAELFPAIERVGSNNAQGEYYLTEIPAMLQRAGKRVSVVDAVPPEDVLSINTPEQLAAVDRVLRGRVAAVGVVG